MKHYSILCRDASLVTQLILNQDATEIHDRWLEWETSEAKIVAPNLL